MKRITRLRVSKKGRALPVVHGLKPPPLYPIRDEMSEYARIATYTVIAVLGILTASIWATYPPIWPHHVSYFR